MAPNNVSPTLFLLQEHAMIQRVVNRAKKASTVHPEFFSTVLNFFRTFVHEYHFKKEELIFYHQAEKRGMSKESTMGLALIEHRLINRYFQEVSQCLQDYKEGRCADNVFLSHFDDYVEMLLNHLDKERFYVYPKCEEILTRKDQEQIIGLFFRVSSEKVRDQFDQFARNIEQYA